MLNKEYKVYKIKKKLNFIYLFLPENFVTHHWGIYLFTVGPSVAEVVRRVSLLHNVKPTSLK